MTSSDIKTFKFNSCSPETLTFDPGEYKLEVWGASGGSNIANSAIGGPGGYAKGILTLNEKTTIFVHVGSQGSNTTTGSGSQGCNGGGYGGTYYCRSGGGATDIRISTDSLYSRIIVAGGGAGTSGDGDHEPGGFGGGFTGGDGKDTLCNAGKGAGQNGETLTCADGTTTTCPIGIFGYGGNTTGSYAGGGGGGWYGGSASRTEEGGGGGSGYALTSSSFKPSSYLLKDPKYYLKDVVLLGGNESIPNPNGVGNITGRMGDGYAKITTLKSNPPPSAPSLLDFSFHGNEKEIKDELRKFSFLSPGNYSAEVRAGSYQFDSTGAFCGISIITEFEFKRSQIIKVSILHNASIYINDELLLNVPAAPEEADAFVFPGMKIIQKYNASEFMCDASNYATMTITLIPPKHRLCTNKKVFSHSPTLLFIYIYNYS